MVANPPSARRYFIALQQIDVGAASSAVRMAIGDGSAFSPITGDTVELDLKSIYTDACDGMGTTAVKQAQSVIAASVPIVAVIGCSCSSSSGPSF